MAAALKVLLLALAVKDVLSATSCSSFNSADANRNIVITATSGVIKSPNYPNNYPSNLDCIWKISPNTSSNSSAVKLVFNSFALEVSSISSGCINVDYLEVIDGTNGGGSVVFGKFCGTKRPENIYSSEGSISIRFQSDAQTEKRGFYISYSSVPLAKSGSCVVAGRSNILTMSGEGGTFYSPRYPLNYPNNMDCTWVLTVPAGKQVKVSFYKLMMETGVCSVNDYIEIRDGQNISSPNIRRKFCSIPVPFLSAGRYLRFAFHSDWSITSTGFLVKFEAVNEAAPEGRCLPYNTLLDQSLTLNKTSGTIASPTYPDPYHTNVNCIWKITVPPNKRIKLTFTDMDLEYQISCSNDYVELRDGLYPSSTKIGRYCGTALPIPRYSSGRNMWVRFHSDHSESGKGFKAKYEAVEVGTVEAFCSPYNSGYQTFTLTRYNGTLQSPNFPSPYANNMDCIWKITVPSGKKVKLTFTHMDLESNYGCTHDYVMLRSGLFSYSSLIGRYCGRSKPSPKFSSGRYMWVKFHSDGSVTRTGFRADYEAVIYTHTEYHSGLSSGAITGLVFAGIAVFVFIVCVSYCKHRNRRPVVIVEAAPTRPSGPSTIVLANVNITEQTSAPPPPQQAMANPAYTGTPDCAKSQPKPTYLSKAHLPSYPMADGAYPAPRPQGACYPPFIPGQGACPPPPQPQAAPPPAYPQPQAAPPPAYPQPPPYSTATLPPYSPPGEAYDMQQLKH